MKTDLLDILYEDAQIIVCVKPHGLPTQSKRAGTPDVESILKNHIYNSNKKSNPGAGLLYLAVIHRLDQPVMGILVFAKTPFAAKELNRQIQQGDFKKHYRALVTGALPAESGTLEDYLVKDGRTNLSQVCKKETAGAKLARLYYQRIENRALPEDAASPLTEVEIHLDTGRHHQIRVQLANIGCPIAGDTKYNPASSASGQWQELKLCAFKLSFLHPKTRKRLTFELPPGSFF